MPALALKHPLLIVKSFSRAESAQRPVDRFGENRACGVEVEGAGDAAAVADEVGVP